MAASSIASRRRHVLDRLADEALAEAAAAEARREAHEEAEKASRKRHAELTERRQRMACERLAAVSEAETAAGELVKALGRVHAAAAGEREAAHGLGVVALGISEDAVARRLSRYLSESLRAVPSATALRFGEMALARYFPQGATSWREAEERAVGTRDDRKETN